MLHTVIYKWLFPLFFQFFCNEIHLTPSNRCTKKEVSGPGLRKIMSILLSAGLFLRDDPGAESAAGGRDHAEHVLPGYDLQKDLCAKVRRTHLALQYCQAPGSRRIQEDRENRRAGRGCRRQRRPESGGCGGR